MSSEDEDEARRLAEAAKALKEFEDKLDELLRISEEFDIECGPDAVDPVYRVAMLTNVIVTNGEMPYEDLAALLATTVEKLRQARRR